MADAILHAWPIVRLKDAKAQGLKLYYTGKPCKYGHLDQRHTSTGQCRTCLKVSWPSHAPEKKRDDAREYRKSNPEKYAKSIAEAKRKNPDKYAGIRSAWLAATKAERLAQTAEWKAANPERWKEFQAAYRTRNPERISAGRQLRRARLKGAKGSHTGEQLKELQAKQRFKCACGCKRSIKVKYHVDHYVPLSLGGSNDILNIQLLHPTCNLRKGALHPIEWARRMGRLL
jgi:5-methylcytosine-specific restriction endonuclease McrA